MDWNFLFTILWAFGLDAQVCKLISLLVASPSLSVLVNGHPSPFFSPSRGLRQGDPISPVLFVIMVECLGRLIQKKIRDKCLVGLWPSSGPSNFTHQQFVDDTILGGEASVREARSFKSILNSYTRGTGQAINLEKSSIFFLILL